MAPVFVGTTVDPDDDEDYDDDYYEDEEVEPAESLSISLPRFETAAKNPRYLAGMLLRVMRHYEPSYAWGFFIGEMLSYQNHWGRQWKEYLRSFDKKPEKTDEPTTNNNPHVYDDILLWHKVLSKENVEHIINLVMEENPGIMDPMPDWHNVSFIADMLDLGDMERHLLKFCAYISEASYHEVNLIYRCQCLYEDVTRTMAVMMDLRQDEVEKCCNKSFLFKSGILEPESDSRLKGFHVVSDEIEHLIFTDVPLTMERLEEELFPQCLSTSLNLVDYGMDEEISLAVGLINEAIKEKQTGVNVLLYGLPGTGKTELALLLAQQNNWNIRVVGDINDNDDQEKGRSLRLVSLKFALKLYRNHQNTILLFDEMEDLFKTDNNAAFSKAFINRIVENASIPIIWTTNSLMSLGNAIVRRMTYSIPFDVPKTAQRIHIWKKYSNDYGLGLSDDDIETLGENFPVVPALISNAAKVARSNKLDCKKLQNVMKNMDRAMSAHNHSPLGVEKEIPKKYVAPSVYDVTLVNCNVNLVELTEKLKAAKPNFTLCLYGPPGTGKSAYARYLSTQLGKQFIFKKASDLQSMWVGECEKNIARAFKEAKERQRVLILDEADSFLYSRESAHRSWEVSQVNEMLTQMESVESPFICTTNLMKNLDEASLRRFTFKINFDFLKPDQAAQMFQRYFGGEAPTDIYGMYILTPGDFANVQKKADIMHITDLREIWNMLEEECKMKPQYSKKIGF